MPIMAASWDGLTPESLREWERRLGPELVAQAMDYVESLGWPRGGNPPLYVWAAAFMEIENRGARLIEQATPPPAGGDR